MTKAASSEHATTDRVSQHVHESVDQIAKSAGKAEQRVRKESAEAEARVRAAGQKTKERSDQTLQSVSGFVRENPWTSAGFAAAAGALLYALRRRS